MLFDLFNVLQPLLEQRVTSRKWRTGRADLHFLPCTESTASRNRKV